MRSVLVYHCRDRACVRVWGCMGVWRCGDVAIVSDCRRCRRPKLGLIWVGFCDVMSKLTKSPRWEFFSKSQIPSQTNKLGAGRRH